MVSSRDWLNLGILSSNKQTRVRIWSSLSDAYNYVHEYLIERHRLKDAKSLYSISSSLSFNDDRYHTAKQECLCWSFIPCLATIAQCRFNIFYLWIHINVLASAWYVPLIFLRLHSFHTQLWWSPIFFIAFFPSSVIGCNSEASDKIKKRTWDSLLCYSYYLPLELLTCVLKWKVSSELECMWRGKDVGGDTTIIQGNVGEYLNLDFCPRS